MQCGIHFQLHCVPSVAQFNAIQNTAMQCSIKFFTSLKTFVGAQPTANHPAWTWRTSSLDQTTTTSNDPTGQHGVKMNQYQVPRRIGNSPVRYFSKVSIYRQSIFDIDISNRATVSPLLSQSLVCTSLSSSLPLPLPAPGSQPALLLAAPTLLCCLTACLLCSCG